MPASSRTAAGAGGSTTLPAGASRCVATGAYSTRNVASPTRITLPDSIVTAALAEIVSVPICVPFVEPRSRMKTAPSMAKISQ